MTPAPRPSIARAALHLMSGRTVGFVASLAMPFVLVRVFSQAEFGTYKQLFLIYSSLFIVVQCGLAESLYYFVPRSAAAGRAVANAVLALAVAGALAAAGLTLAAGPIGAAFTNPDLARFLPAIGVVLALTIVAAVLEIALVSRDRYRTASAVYAGSDIVRAALLVGPAVVTRSVAGLVAGAVVFGVARVAALGGYLAREFGSALRPDAAAWRAQLAYTLPFAAAVLVEVAQASFHQYAVAAWFDPATFAIYAAGCLQIPLVDLLATSSANVMMVRMAEERAAGRPVDGLWRDTIRHLALVFFPLAALLAVTAPEVVVVLFTEGYAASAPVFAVSAAAIVLAAVPVDAALRVFAETRFLLGMNLGRLAFIAAGIGVFVAAFGLPGAVLVTVVAAAGAKLGALVRIGRAMDVPFRRTLPWPALGLTGLAVAAALVPVAAVRAVAGLPPALLAAAGAAVFVPAYLAVAAACGLLPPAVLSGLRRLVPGVERS